MTGTTTSAWGGLAQPVRQDSPGGGVPPWKDNAYLTFWDPAREVNGVVHVSTSPNAEGRRARASVSIGARSAEVVEELEPGSFEGASVNYVLEGRILVDSPEMVADLELVPWGRPCDYGAGKILPELVEGEPLQHFQGAAKVSGTITVLGEEVNVDGVGLRDRTWGYRDEATQFSEYIGLIAHLDDRMLTVMKWGHQDGGARSEGFLLGEGDADRVEDLTAITRDASGLFAAATVVGTDGEGFEVRRTRRTGGFWVPMGWERQGPAMSAYDEFFELRFGGGRDGYGMVEQGIVRRLV